MIKLLNNLSVKLGNNDISLLINIFWRNWKWGLMYYFVGILLGNYFIMAIIRGLFGWNRRRISNMQSILLAVPFIHIPTVPGTIRQLIQTKWMKYCLSSVRFLSAISWRKYVYICYRNCWVAIKGYTLGRSSKNRMIKNSMSGNRQEA